jgi:hypothetical protein
MAGTISVRDKLSLLVGATAPEIELLHDPALEISGLRWSSVLPGGHASLSFSIACPNPLLALRNALRADNKIWLKYGTTSIWEGWILPLETEIGETDGAVNIECEGTLARAGRNEGCFSTWVDSDTSNWYQPDAHNNQIGGDNQGQLLLYSNKGDAIEANKAGLWYYSMSNIFNGPHPRNEILTKITYDYDINVDASNWIADISSDKEPWWGTWTVDRAWTNTSGTGTGQSTTITDADIPRGLRLRLYSSNDVTSADRTSTRYIKLTNVKVYTQALPPTIDSAMYDLLCTGARLIGSTGNETETLDAINHCTWRDPASIAAMCADLATRTDRTVDWALWGSILYCKERPTPAAHTTVALRRSDLVAGADGIFGDHESAVDYVYIVYSPDDAIDGVPIGFSRMTGYGSYGITNRMPVLDYSGEVMSQPEARALAQQEYTRRNGDVYRGSVTLPLDRPLVNMNGAPIDPLLILPGRGWAVDRTYQIGHAPLTITATEFDLDSETVAITVGPQEERQPWLPASKPKAGARRVKKFGPWRTVKGRRTRKSWWEFQ